MKRFLTTLTSLLLIAGFVLSTSSCASTTIINSHPQGAKVYMNQEYMGVTPYTYTDTKVVGTSTIVKLTKDGYQDTNVILTRNEQVDVGAIIGGLCVWVPFLWVMGYNPSHTYELYLLGAQSKIPLKPS